MVNGEAYISIQETCIKASKVELYKSFAAQGGAARSMMVVSLLLLCLFSRDVAACSSSSDPGFAL